ncbi:MAG TPA: haloacid dehalogenase-like hydrolase, partial [Burkholderiales bacterium]|nr:haloacid dehalogenase-like hydrolase [Burkholderiales bacterium]
EQRAGEFTGKVSDIPCFREGKVQRLEAWLARMGHSLASFDESWFYSDSLNDLPLLGRVTHPVAVDPDDTLREHATRHGWPVITLS